MPIPRFTISGWSLDTPRRQTLLRSNGGIPTRPFSRSLAKASFALAVLSLASSGSENAAEYPTRPIRYIVASGASGASDLIARTIGAELARQMGQSVVIDNRPGAGGTVGTEAIARAPRDGYTIGHGTSATLAVNPGLYTKLPYDPQKDIQPVAQLIAAPNLLIVTLSLPVRSVRELLEHAKNNPGKLSYASAGSGTTVHIGMELLKLITGTMIVHVPFKTSAQAMNDLIGARVHVALENMGASVPHVKAARVRALGVSALQRVSALPEVPTIAESGVPGYEVLVWSGVVVPSGTPMAVISKLNTEINQALLLPSIREKLLVLEYEPVGGTAGQFGALINKEALKWAEIIRRTGAKID